MNQAQPIPRLYYLDALRALALLGILMVHCHNRFNFWLPDILPTSPPAMGCWVDFFYEHLLFTKSALLFALLFGMSFALQMQRSQQRGVDFRGRFAWRLCLLFVIGLLHSLFYCGDILMIFAVLGFIPLLCWRWRLPWTALLCFILLLNPLALWNDIPGQAGSLFHACMSFELPAMPSPIHASWAELAQWNISYGIANAWLFMLWGHRLCPTIGMFLLGLLIGKLHLLDTHQDQQLKLGLMALLLWLGLLALPFAGLPQLLPTCLQAWANICYVCAFAALVSVLLRQNFLQKLIPALAAMGKMTLSCYLTQSLVMTYLLADWGCGLLSHLNPMQVMGIGLLLYLLQILCCMLWLKRFRYGPVEGLWRKLTNIQL